MQFLYDIGIFGLGLIMRLAGLFNTKAKLWVDGRKNLYSNVPEGINENLVWFHCASLGEFDQALPLMNKLKENDKTLKILVTFFSPSGMKHYHKRNHVADFVMYLPLDTKANASEFFSYFRPKKGFFVKYEFWSNFIFEARKNGILLYNVSGIFRENHRYFKWYGSYFRKTLKAFEWFFVQNESSLELLKTIGIINVSITGDSRYDRVIENKKLFTSNKILASFCQNDDTLVIGSSWPEDEKLFLSFIQNKNQKTLIAPHNIDEKHIQSLIKQYPKAVRYTKANEENVKNKQILILDTIGQLSSAYSYGKIAYVGGGFSGNLHNILEPAVFGLPVIFGPKHERFPEAQAFIDLGIGRSISTPVEFEKAFMEIQQNIGSLSAKTSNFIQQNKGAAERIITQLTAN